MVSRANRKTAGFRHGDHDAAKIIPRPVWTNEIRPECIRAGNVAKNNKPAEASKALDRQIEIADVKIFDPELGYRAAKSHDDSPAKRGQVRLLKHGQGR